MKESDCEKIVYQILALWNKGMKDDITVIESLQSEFGMSTEDAELALELTKTGLFRAAIISGGNRYPKNNLNKNPIVRSALKIGIAELRRLEQSAPAAKKEKPWWRFW